MQEVEFVEKKGYRIARIKNTNLPDIPRPYTIILKTTVQNEFETIALTKIQYEGILADLESGKSGIILNGNYHDRYSIYKVKTPI